LATKRSKCHPSGRLEGPNGRSHHKNDAKVGDFKPEKPQRPDEGLLFRLAMIAVLVLALLSPFVMIYIVWKVVLRVMPALWNLLSV
jgi:hypothetical protein